MAADAQDPGRRILRELLKPAEGTEMDFKAVLDTYIRTREGYAQIADWGGEGLAASALYEARLPPHGVHHYPYNRYLGRQLAYWASNDN